MGEYQESAKAHLRRLNGLIEKGSVPRIRGLYVEAAQGLERQLARAVGSGASPFTIQKAQSMLAQARQGLVRLSVHLGAAMNEQTVIAQESSANAMIMAVKRMEKVASGAVVQLPIEQAARFAGVVDARRTSLMSLNTRSMAKYGASVVVKVEQTIGVGLLQGLSGFEMVQGVSEVIGGELWRAERIARTETAWAYNATQMDAIGATKKTFPDIMMRWVEYVADVTLAKLDARVGDDSCAMHGQLARPGASFGMPLVNPPNLKISPSMLGMQWTFPPNRPNDRSVLQPWRPGWGWGWELIDGQRVVRK